MGSMNSHKHLKELTVFFTATFLGIFPCSAHPRDEWMESEGKVESVKVLINVFVQPTLEQQSDICLVF